MSAHSHTLGPGRRKDFSKVTQRVNRQVTIWPYPTHPCPSGKRGHLFSHQSPLPSNQSQRNRATLRHASFAPSQPLGNLEASVWHMAGDFLGAGVQNLLEPASRVG